MSLHRLDEMKDDCVLGSEFINRVSIVVIDAKNMIFKFMVKGCLVSCPMTHSGVPKCHEL